MSKERDPEKTGGGLAQPEGHQERLPGGGDIETEIEM